MNHTPTAREGYQPDGVQTNRLRPQNFPPGVKPFKILFMGDSYMQGYKAHQTVPQYIWDYYQTTDLKDRPLLLWNAGYSSYAPTIYIVQAKKLIPKYRPDLVVVDIDESDLVDDFSIYRPCLVRDAAGKIIAVKPSSVYTEKVMGHVRLKKIPLYTVRLVLMWWHKWFRMNWIYHEAYLHYKAKYYRHPLSDTQMRYSFNLVPDFDESPDAREKYAEEIRFFEGTVRELAETLVSLAGGPERVLFLHHPHLHQLVPDSRGFLWRNLAGEIVSRAAREAGAGYYDATEDLRAAFGGDPSAYYFPRDMHYNYAGMKLYAEAVARRLEPLIKGRVESEDKALPAGVSAGLL